MSLSDTLAKRMRLLRASRKLSQADLADRAGRSTEAISNIERGLSSPTLKMIEKLAAALDVPASDLIIEASSVKGEENFSKLIALARKLPANDLELAVALMEALVKARKR